MARWEWTGTLEDQAWGGPHVAPLPEGAAAQALVFTRARSEVLLMRLPNGGYHLECCFESGQDHERVLVRCLQDEPLRACMMQCFQRPLVAGRLEAADGVVRVNLSDGPDFRPEALPALVDAWEQVAPDPDRSRSRTCVTCRDAPGEPVFDDSGYRLSCPACAGRVADRARRASALARPPSEVPPLRPPPPILPDLDHEALRAEAEAQAQAYQQDPAGFLLRLRGWVLLGRAALATGLLIGVGAALGLVGLVIALFSIGWGAAILLIKLLFSFKILKFLAIGLVAAGAVLRRAWGSLVELFFGPPAPPREEGLSLTRAKAPKLFRWLDDLAQRAQAPPVDRVVLYEGFSAFAAERRVGPLRHEAVVGIGLPRLALLDREEFTAVMAHELGHLSHRDSRSLAVFRVAGDWLAAAQAMKDQAPGLFTRFATWYLPRFLVRANVLRREHEYRADRFSVEVAGAPAMVRALVRVSLVGNVYGRALDRGLRQVAHEWTLSGASGSVLPAHGLVGRGLPQLDVARDWSQLLALPLHWTDSHPPLPERLAALGFQGDLAAALQGGGGPPALDLLDDAPQYLAELEKQWPQVLALRAEALADALRGLNRYAERLASEPLTANRLAHRGRVLFEADRDDEALVELERALQLDPEHFTARKNLIALQAYHHRWSEVLRLIREAVPAGAGFQRLHWAAENLESAGAWGEAAVLWRRMKVFPQGAEHQEALEQRARQAEQRHARWVASPSAGLAGG